MCLDISILANNNIMDRRKYIYLTKKIKGKQKGRINYVTGGKRQPSFFHGGGGSDLRELTYGPKLLHRPAAWNSGCAPIPGRREAFGGAPVPAPSVSSSSSYLRPGHLTGKLGSPTPDWAYLQARAQHFSAHLRPNCSSSSCPHSPYLPPLLPSRHRRRAVRQAANHAA
jgi:hypothetical protein